jgi:hypothetical protein
MSEKELAWRQSVIENSMAKQMSKYLDEKLDKIQSEEDEQLWDE